MNIKKVNVMGIHVSTITEKDLNQFIIRTIRESKRALVLNVNAHAINLSFQLEWFKNFLNKSEVVFADGFGVIFAARILGHEIPERITYAEWTWKLAEFAENNELSVYFLGGKPGIAQLATDNLTQKFPKLRISGTHHGYFIKEPGHPDNEEVLSLINQARPDILLVGFGMPLQEDWLEKNWAKLNAKVALTGGAVFDYLSGSLVRAPRFMTENGLEWLGRLLIEPKRLWKRYIIGIPIFIYRLIIFKTSK